MEKIFTTKISLQSRNPRFSYPIIRLPRDLKELAGQTVNIYQTEIGGVRGFFVVPHLANLAKLDENIDDSNRTYSLPKCGLIDQSTPANEWARPDLNRRPPPCEGGGFVVYFSIFWPLSVIFWDCAC
jgi:hypothetical protein